MPVQADVRVICATHVDLHKAVQEGRFREDLFYRLNVFPLHLPALRERADDILLLADHFLSRLSRRFKNKSFTISAEASLYLKNYAWPGNVRELQNTLERAAILSHGGRIEPKFLETSANDYYIKKINSVRLKSSTTLKRGLKPFAGFLTLP